MPPFIRPRAHLSELDRRLLLRSEAIGDVAERLAREQVQAVIDAGERPAAAVAMLGLRPDPGMSRTRATAKLRDEWLRMASRTPALLEPYRDEVAARMAYLEAEGRPWKEYEE